MEAPSLALALALSVPTSAPTSALTVTFALLASLVCALTVVPVLAYLFIGRIRLNVDAEGEPRNSFWIRAYTPTIALALTNVSKKSPVAPSIRTTEPTEFYNKSATYKCPSGPNVRAIGVSRPWRNVSASCRATHGRCWRCATSRI